MLAKERVRLMWLTAEKHCDNIAVLSCDDSYEQSFEAVKLLLWKEHFIHNRMETRLSVISAKQNVYRKKQNQIQQSAGVDRTLKADGLIPFSDLRAARNTDDLEEELRFRGEIFAPKTTFTALRTQLKQHEVQRVAAINHEDRAAIERASKGFEIISTAPFHLMKDDATPE